MEHRRVVHEAQLPGDVRALEINGFWPSGPNQPFGGFGRVDPNRGLVYQQTNNTWSTLEWKAIEATIAKNMSNNFQVLIGINRQWQHFGGTWNPTDPARFIQPDAFPSTRLLYMPRGNNEDNSLPIPTARPCTPTVRRGRTTRCASAARIARRGVSICRRATPSWPVRGQEPSSTSFRPTIRRWRFWSGQLHVAERHRPEQSAEHPHALRRRRRAAMSR